MKIAIIADIHANLESFEKFSKIVKKEDVDTIYHLGDFVDYCCNPNEVIELAKELKIVSIKGNHDFALVAKNPSGFNPYALKAHYWTRENISKESLEYLKKLPIKIEREIGNFKLVFIHGSPLDYLNDYIFPRAPASVLQSFLEREKCNILFVGHSHMLFVRKIKNGYVVNPGSIGQPRDGNWKPSFIIAEFSKGNVNFKVKRYSYNVKETARKIIENGLPKFLAFRLFYGI